MTRTPVLLRLSQRDDERHYARDRQTVRNMTDSNDTVSFEKEWEKMLGGEIYDATHPEFLLRLANTRRLIQEYNGIDANDVEQQRVLLKRIIPSMGDNFHFNQPFRCDYGSNIAIGDNFFANFNLTILDEARVEIGDNVFVGPNVSIYTACHPLDPDERRDGREWAEGVRIGNDVWIGGNAVILPGVTVGDGAVIGAGAVVTKDVATRTVVAGNPARKIKNI